MVALRVIFRDADVLVHVERLHILEAHFSSLVRLRETCGDGNMIIFNCTPGPVSDTSQEEFLLYQKNNVNVNIISADVSFLKNELCGHLWAVQAQRTYQGLDGKPGI